MTSTGSTPTAEEPIAVIGMSCRLPGADNPEQLWELLRDGVDAITDVPDARWPDHAATDFRRGGFLRRVDGFDAEFFGVGAAEAAAMDPQQRLVLELAWEALERARIAPTALRGTATGVFVGAIGADYALLHDRLGADAAGPYTVTGTHRSLIANRVSYLLGLRGPSLTLDSGQSSSLVAVQLAAEQLRRGTVGLALAGGVNLNLLGQTSAVLGEFGALSPDGRCHTFDSRANGYVRGEGGGLVVLKPLAAALADGDPVHAVLLGGAVNNDGGGTGLTDPDRAAQEAVLRQAYRRAGVAPADVQYVELHGTGTRVGDPVEAAALGAALGSGRPAGQPLAVGSVKTNIGHLEGAAGIAGLLKVVLSLRHGALPASLNFATPHPDIPLAELNLDVVRATRDWPATDRRVAGVSAFGMGGTNCHLVLTEAPRPAAAPTGDDAPAGDSAAQAGDGTGPAALPEDVPLLLSAHTGAALRARAGQLADHLDAYPEVPPADVALSLLRTRAHLGHRAVLLGPDRAALGTGLRDLAAERATESVVLGRAVTGGDALIFPGQGSQWPAMARQLLAGPAADRLVECVEAVQPHLDYPLLDVLRAEPGAADLDRTDVVQPALWAVMVALAELWRRHGVHPELVIGHSQGEIAAATVVGALDLADAARVVALRSRAVARLATGGMMSVTAAPAELDRLLADADGVSVAVHNGPRSLVLAGPADTLAALEPALVDAGHRTRILPVRYASHSPVVDELRDELRAALAPIRPRSTETLFVSTVTGAPVDTATLDADYWFANLRRPVRFADATRWALEHGCRRFLECSPHPVLLGGVEETAEEADREVVTVGTLRRDDGGPDRVRRAVAEAYVGGAAVDWDRYCAPRGARPTDLPTYPFQRSRHWLDAVPARPAAGVAAIPTADDTPAVPALTRAQVHDLVLGAAAAVLGHDDPAAIDPGQTFKDLGFDSAGVVELRNRVRTLTGLRLPTTLLFDFPTPGHLITTLHDRLAAAGEPPTAEPAPATPVTAGTAGTAAEPIAIVGMACRYPGAVTGPEELWRLLVDEADAVSALPTNRGWDLDELHGGGDGQPGTCVTPYGGFLHDADRFDPAFFGLSPREALAMEPQQRLLLEICWEAVEQAGLDPTGLAGSPTGVFVGAMASDYGPRLHQPGGIVDGHLLTGTALSVASGRIAYTLGLTGPALTVDTACSSSLVAIGLAVRSLRAGESTLALAGGATVMANPGNLVEFSRQNGLSPDGRAKAFSAAADGTAFAEGAGVLLLERLSDARRNGHPVLAVIRGVAINSDGASNGLTAPNGQAQQRAIRQALADAGLRAADVDAVEAHGTGTALGDPIEAHALLATYGQDRPADAALWLGSVKSNIGHTQAAAGVAGVIKMVLAMRHRTLPRTLHVDRPTERVDWASGAVRVLTEARSWPATGRPARAAVSSFGISGTNAHLVLEAVPATGPAPATVDGPLLWVLSARSEAALREHGARLARWARAAAEPELAAAGPLLARRPDLPYRAVLLAADRAELVDGLDALATGADHPALHTGTAARDTTPVFLFPGQGAQWAGMATELLAQNPVFAAALHECAEALRPYTGWSVVDVLTGADGAPGLDGTDVVQPVLFAVNVALAALWRAAGVEPAAVVGHSQGEIAGAYVAGALPLAEAAKIIATRSGTLGRLDGTGGVLAVGLPAAEVRELITRWPDALWLAVDNGPTGTVVAGDLAAIEEFAAGLDASVPVRRTPVAYAAHTPHVAAVRADLYAGFGELHPVDAPVAICSSLLGDFVAGGTLTADYWYRNLAEPVDFDTAVRAFRDRPRPLFIEVSPHPILAGAVQEILADAGLAGSAVPTLRRGCGGQRQFLEALATGYVRGAPVAWPTVLGPARRHVELPARAFDRQRYWLAGADRDTSVTPLPHPLLRTVVPVAGSDGLLLTGRLSRSAAGWLADHAVTGTVLVPGTALAEFAVQAATAAGLAAVEDLTLSAPLTLPATGARQVQVAVGAPDAEGRRELTIHSRPDGRPDAGWTRHAAGTVGGPADATERLGQWPPAGAAPVDLAGAYPGLAERGYEYGPTFRGLTAAWRAGTDLYAEVRLPAGTDVDGFAVHPALLDAALHPLVLGLAADDTEELLLPFSFTGVRLATRGVTGLRVRLRPLGDRESAVTLWDETGAPLGGIAALTLRPAPAGRVPVADVQPYRLDWVTADLAVLSGDALAARRWAVLGAGPAATALHATLAADGVAAVAVADLDALPDPVPPVVLAPTPESTDDGPDATRATLRDVLDLLRRWLAEDRCAAARLVVLADHRSPVGAAVWGLVRSAQTENPDRFGLATPVTAGTAGLLAAALDADEPQIDLDGGRVPRLARWAGQPGPAPDLTDGTVLVTGGTSGLGALVATHLAGRYGVRDLLLTSRRGADAPGVADLVARLRELGAEARVAACDVADRNELAALLATAPRPLVGVVHAAGVLADATVAGLEPERLETVLRPKVDGGRLLHELTAGQPLRMFVLFSSVAAVLGNAGQGNYAAANAYLDALAARRRAAGLPAISLAWGLWSVPTGMTSVLTDTDLDRLAAAGVAPLDAAEGLALLDAALTATGEAALVPARFDPARLRARAAGGAPLNPVLRGLVRRPTPTATVAAGAAAAPTDRPAPLADRVAGLAPAEAVGLLTDLVRGQVAVALGHRSPTTIDLDRPLRELGLDSLTSVELRNRLGAETGLRLPASLVFHHPTVTLLARHLHEELAPPAPDGPDGAAAEALLRDTLDRLGPWLAGAEPAQRDRVAATLREALERVGGHPPTGPAPADPAAAGLDLASDEEIFAFIDTQL
jgi:acyl transferase domain-containing protein